MTTPGAMPGFGGGSSNYASDNGGGRERGARRKKLAGYLKAANEVRQSYQSSYASSWGSRNADEYDADEGGIPGAFPDVAIVRNKGSEMVLFPSYARRHVKNQPKGFAGDSRPSSRSSSRRGSRVGMGDRDSGQNQLDDDEFWRREWEKFEQDKAVVDVDVRGWIYSPHSGPMNRKNRLLIGLARHLSGIPQPKKGSRDSSPSRGEGEHGLRARHEAHQAQRDQERIAREAEEILRKGKGEEDVANRGGYSEPNYESDRDSMAPRSRGSESQLRNSPNSPQSGIEGAFSKSSASSFVEDEGPGPGHMMKQTSWNNPAEMSQAEMLVANANLMARLRPFLTNPLISTPITVFFYNDKTSQSRTVITDDAGHFTMRAALDFVPTNIRVLASEDLSATEEVRITEPKGVSVISDVDDTVNHSSIGSGSKEIFRNVFVRDLGDLTIQGVKEWYGKLYEKGVGFHYVSNSPWQLYPLLVSFFRTAELPSGSYHLKQYSGMLQGIFEPVAERKKGTLERIMRDFPERRFLLVGDSGEADLEVYTDVVLANPGRIIGVFIRDVTTPPDQNRGFFDSSMASGERSKRKIAPPPNLGSGTSSGYASRNDSPTNSSTTRSNSPSIGNRPPLPPRIHSDESPATRPPLPARGLIKTEVATQSSAGPAMGNLIDFDSDPEELLPPPPRIHESRHTVISRSKSDVQIGDTAKAQANHLNSVVPTREPSFRAPPLVKTKPLALRANSQGEAKEVWNVPVSKPLTELEKSDSTPLPPPKPRQLSTRTESTITPSSIEKEREDRGRQGSHPLSQTQNTSDLSSPLEAQTWGAYGKEKVMGAYNKLPAAKDYIPAAKKGGKESSPYDSLIYSAAAKSTQKGNSSIKSVKTAPPPPPPRRSKAPKTETTTPDTSEEDEKGNPILKTSSYPSYSASPQQTYSRPDNQPVSKKVMMWRQRVKRAEEILRNQGVVLRIWRVGGDVCDDAVELVEKELKALGVQPGRGGEKTVKKHERR